MEFRRIGRNGAVEVSNGSRAGQRVEGERWRLEGYLVGDGMVAVVVVVVLVIVVIVVVVIAVSQIG